MYEYKCEFCVAHVWIANESDPMTKLCLKITLFSVCFVCIRLEVILWSVCVCVYAFFFVLFDFDHSSLFFVVHIVFSLMYGMSTTMAL